MERLLVASIRRPLTLKRVSIRSHGWVCQSCRTQQARAAAGIRFTSSSSSENGSKLSQQQDGKPYYVTTPIFYVNSTPHIGHLYSMTVADVLKRWEVLKGREAVLSTGTDEHGMKIQQAAEKQDLRPQVLCDTNAESFKSLAKAANIDNDHFIRTTDPKHREAVGYFWDRLREKGYIYENKHEGWYCVSDETFYPEDMVEKRVSPSTGKPVVVSIETGNVVEWTEEKNYHFRLTAFRERLLEFYKENPSWVVPESRFKEVVHWVENNLEDLSVSRPSSRLSWGIRVPHDESQTIYVWLDALVNYLTTAGYPLWPPGTGRTGTWPADVHVVGKDIIRFHCIYWPAFLMALDLPLPKQVLSHGHWLMSKQKMSKSIGNVVNPFVALNRWGVDVLRFYLIHGGHVSNDCDYDNELLVRKYKRELLGTMGNLLNRITRSKKWNVRPTIEKMTEIQAMELLPLVEQHQEFLKEATQKVDAHMKALNPGAALKETIEILAETNKMISNTEPWAMHAKGNPEHADQVILLGAEALRIAGILLQPFMPEKSATLLNALGVKPDRRAFQDAVLYVDDSYGEGEHITMLFPPLPVED